MKITEALFKKYIEGECTEQEKRLVEEWLNSGEGTLSDFSTREVAQMKERTWEKLEKRHQFRLEVSGESAFKESKATILPLYRKVFRYAAVAVMAISLGFTSYYFLSTTGVDSGKPSVALEDYQTISNGRGQRKSVELPDGTTVWLNNDTQIKVPEEFSEEERIVYLAGHAHFHVIRNPEKPFIIYTEGTKTQVLGTSFDINTNDPDLGTEIIVTSGKVVFSEKNNLDNRVTLTVDQRAVISDEKTIALNEVDAQRLTAWKTDRLVFDDETLGGIIKVLEPWYNVRIHVEN
ncbi:MAG: FecR domain-containing protein, partial [Bacteroidota bacterium]